MVAMSQANGAPVWMTVICARVIGGFAVGFLSYSVLASAHPAAGASAAWSDALTFVPAVIGALVTGLAITLLLPSISGRRVGLGNAILAAFAGAMLPLITGLVIVGSAARASSGSIVAVAGAGVLLTLLVQILGIAVTAWMVSSSSADGERWRGRPVAPNPRWSSIEAIDRDRARLDHEQAERGYWGSMTDPE
jgi:hypothetical protein